MKLRTFGHEFKDSITNLMGNNLQNGITLTNKEFGCGDTLGVPVVEFK